MVINWSWSESPVQRTSGQKGAESKYLVYMQNAL